MEERVLLQSNCSLYRVTTKEELDSFSCGDEDLDDFFHREACLYDGQLLGKTYFFATERSGKDEIVCAFTLANDSIKAALIPNASRNRIQRKIPNSKRFLRHSQIFEQLFVLTNTKEVFWNMQALKYR